MTVPKKIAFYVRVSRTSQDFPSQLHALKAWCERHGWSHPPKARIFAEKITGKIARRTQLDKLLQACREGHVDTILVFRADRAGNSAQHMHNLLAELDRLKVRLVGVEDGIDTAVSNSATVTFRNLLIGFAEGARMLVSERTVAGLRAANAAGRFGGRPRKNDAKIARAKKLLTGKTPCSLRSAARTVGLEPGYLSRELRAAGR